MKKKWFNSKIVAISITIAIVVIIFYSGPANAIKLGMEIPQKIISIGKSINIISTIQIESGELLQIDYLELKLNGPHNKNIDCKFLSNGTIISGCEDITIKPISLNDSSKFGYSYGYRYADSLGYGYGYGYGIGILKYNITIDSDDLSVGNYSTELLVIVGDKTFKFLGDNIKIAKKVIPTRLDNRCSIRAFDGTFNVDNKDFSNNRLKFYISTRDINKITGTGSLSGQKGRDRFSYRFKIDKVVENNQTNLVLQVSGVYRIGRDGVLKNIQETAVLNFDKINNKIIVRGNKVNIKSMTINFIEGCDSIKQMG
jgi:hypothetical protein